MSRTRPEADRIGPSTPRPQQDWYGKRLLISTESLFRTAIKHVQRLRSNKEVAILS